MFKRKYTDSELLDAVYARDSKLIKHIMQLVWSQVRSIVTENNGTNDDAMQVMQDAFIAIYSKKEKPILVSTFSTYFISVCKNLWHYELRKRKVKKEGTLVLFLHPATDPIGLLSRDLFCCTRLLLQLLFFADIS